MIITSSIKLPYGFNNILTNKFTLFFCFNPVLLSDGLSLQVAQNYSTFIHYEFPGK